MCKGCLPPGYIKRGEPVVCVGVSNGDAQRIARRLEFLSASAQTEPLDFNTWVVRQQDGKLVVGRETWTDNSFQQVCSVDAAIEYVRQTYISK